MTAALALEGVFSSGGNIRELRALAGSTAGLWFSESMQSVFGTVAELAKPVIAVVNGLCFGAGLALAMAADLRIAADTAVFSSPQVGLGIIPGLGGGQRAIRLCGRGPAKHSILTGGRINAESALRMGLVELVVPAPELWAVARSMATLLASKPQHPMALAKRAVNLAQQASLGAGCAYEASQFGLIGWPQSFEHLSPGTSWVEGECC